MQAIKFFRAFALENELQTDSRSSFCWFLPRELFAFSFFLVLTVDGAFKGKYNASLFLFLIILFLDFAGVLWYFWRFFDFSLLSQVRLLTIGFFIMFQSVVRSIWIKADKLPISSCFWLILTGASYWGLISMLSQIIFLTFIDPCESTLAPVAFSGVVWGMRAKLPARFSNKAKYWEHTCSHSWYHL